MVRRLIFEVCANCGDKIEDDEKALLIDEHNDLIFCDGGCVNEYFSEQIEALEEEHVKIRGSADIPLKKFKEYESYLSMVLGEPDEIWEGEQKEDEHPLSYYIGEFFHQNEGIYYVAIAYRVDGQPTFVFMHFPTTDLHLIEKYRRGEIVFDGAQEQEENLDLEDDEITEGNIAIELYNDMLDHRSEVDIDPEDFHTYNELKLMTVEKPDEIWRRIDDSGNTFVIFIARFQREPEAVAYVVVAVEDELSGTAVPVFGFPTIDQKLLDRFRTGEAILKEEF